MDQRVGSLGMIEGYCASVVPHVRVGPNRGLKRRGTGPNAHTRGWATEAEKCWFDGHFRRSIALPTVKPKLGKLEKATARQFAYVANKDVTGDDYFAIDFRYDRHGQRHRATLAVTVHNEPSGASIRPRGEAMSDEYGIARWGTRGSSLQCAGALRCSCRVQCGDIPVGKASPAFAACMEKCVKAKESAQR